MYGGMCTGTYTNMTIQLGRWAKQHKIHVEFEFIFNESIVSRARCDLAHMFLQSDCTHMVFVDADISLDPLDLMRMVFLTRPGTVVGAPCSCKSINWTRLEQAVQAGVPKEKLQEVVATFNFNLPEGVSNITLNELTAVSHIGTGVMCIHREALDRFRDNTPDLAFEQGGERRHLYFDVAVRDNTLVSEDVLFCRRANDIGIPVLMAPWVCTSHWGSNEFRGNLAMATQVFSS
jgi:hypothetical protein